MIRLVRHAPPADALLFSSPEPKAWQTLEPAAAGPVPRPVVHDPRFGEVRRPADTWAGGWRAERQAYVAGQPDLLAVDLGAGTWRRDA